MAVLCLLSTLAGPCALLALDPHRAVTQYILETWTSENGLPQNTVHRILQTRDGFLWIGTESGLVRFDGIEFRLFNRANTPALSRNSIQGLYEDRKGTLWVGNDGGACCYAAGRFFDTPATVQLRDKPVTSFFEDATGTLWAVGRHAVYRLRSLSAQAFPVPMRLTSTSLHQRQAVNVLFENDGGVLFAGTNTGLFRLEGGRFRPEPGFETTPVRMAFRDRSGTLWMVSGGGNWHRVARGGFEPVVRPGGEGLSPGSFISAVVEDRDANLWVGTARDGIRRIHGGALARLTGQEGLNDNFIRCLYEDREGSLWIGTHGGGLTRLKDGKLSVLGRPEGLPDEMTWCALESRSGHLWVGSEGGLTRFDGSRCETFDLSRGLSNNSVHCLYEDPARTLWIGTWSGGLNRMETGGRITPVVLPGLSSGEILSCIVPSRDGSLWIGTRGGGLKRLRDGVIQAWTTRNGLSSNDVLAVAEDRDGTLWVATDDGFDRLADGQVRPVGQEPWKLHLRSLFLDREGTLWAGTNQYGLVGIRDGQARVYGAAQGFTEDPVTAIIDNAAGDTLWVSTFNGIHAVLRKDLDALDAGLLSRLPCRVFGPADGMRNRECNGLSHPPACRYRLGRLWFPSVSGVVIVDERFMKRNPVPPPVSIETVTVDGEHHPAEGTPEYPPGVGSLEFHYTALSLLWPHQVRFKYRLEGYDAGWVDPGARRDAYYTNLPPGRYTFRVIACNNDGVWNQAGAAFSFYLRPRFHQTVGFQALVVLALALGAWGMLHLRVRHLKARKRELEERVTERTEQLAEANRKLQELDRMKTDFLNMAAHELRTPLTSVVGFAKIVRKKQEELLALVPGIEAARNPRSLAQVRGNMDIIVSEGERLTHLINDLLDIAKLEAGKIEWRMERLEVGELVRHAVESTSSLFEQYRLSAEERVDPGLPAVRGDRERLLQVLLNLLSNAVKFTREGERVTVEARLAHERVEKAAAGPPGTVFSESGGGEPPDEAGGNGRRRVVVSVRDRGVGIAPEDLPAVFEKFTQLGPNREGVLRGTGLGLTISRQIVEHHGGRIWVDSTPGLGSVFSFSLPIETEPGPTGLPDPGIAAQER
ncbi:MAG: hypothetical protein KA419_02605 [Acidobacteria bacterium]|nr:hypothetical protein [Acidobacteriota bacterium]